MGFFDFLIDKNNGKPKSNMEYIYRLDESFIPKELINKPIKFGTIMINVIQLPNGSYEFINKENGEKLTTNYGWALAENTSENRKRIEMYEKEYNKFKKHENKINSLKNEIITLKPKQ